MIGRKIVLAFLLITAALASGLPADPASPAKGLLTADQWVGDLRFLAKNLPKTHRSISRGKVLAPEAKATGGP